MLLGAVWVDDDFEPLNFTLDCVVGTSSTTPEYGLLCVMSLQPVGVTYIWTSYLEGGAVVLISAISMLVCGS